ncbi:transposase [Acrocarpospora sp. B8E8]|uniref:IS66 family transposase n=1 Tax=Acrocarpospora sp. B8E8 TaxID=3153572 RepID=UPI00325E402C
MIGIGANLRALVVYLLVYQHVPVDRCVQLIADLTGAEVSRGFVHGMLTRCAALLGEVTHWIWTLLLLAKVIGLDETTLRVGPKSAKRYALSASTDTLTAFHLGKRDLASFIGFGFMPWYRGVIVHDRYGLYFHRFWQVAGHQACQSHLLRDFEDAGQAYPGTTWPEQAQRALRGLIHQHNLARQAGQSEITPQLRDPLITEFRRAVVVGLHDVPRVPGPKKQVKQKVGRELLEFCRDHEDWVLAFCYGAGIWPTNNLSERDLRPEKTQQKISGRLTSEDATQARLDIRGCISTVRKHGVPVMRALRDVITGTPWRPPMPTAVP